MVAGGDGGMGATLITPSGKATAVETTVKPGRVGVLVYPSLCRVEVLLPKDWFSMNNSRIVA